MDKIDSVKVVTFDKLTAFQETQFKRVLKEAATNQFLGGDEEEVVPSNKRCRVILLGEKEEPVGFYLPKKQNWLGTDYWRAGTLYIAKSQQRKGIMGKVLEDFFSSHQPGLSWIEDSNTSSIKLFTSLGFTKSTKKDDGDRPGHWWKKEVALKGANESFLIDVGNIPVYAKW